MSANITKTSFNAILPLQDGIDDEIVGFFDDLHRAPTATDDSEAQPEDEDDGQEGPAFSEADLEPLTAPPIMWLHQGGCPPPTHRTLVRTIRDRSGLFFWLGWGPSQLPRRDAAIYNESRTDGCTLEYWTMSADMRIPVGAEGVHTYWFGPGGQLIVCWLVNAEVHWRTVMSVAAAEAARCAKQRWVLETPIVYHGEFGFEEAKSALLPELELTESAHENIRALNSLLADAGKGPLCGYCSAGANIAPALDAGGERVVGDDGVLLYELALCASCCIRCGEAAGCDGAGGRRAAGCLRNRWVSPEGNLSECCSECAVYRHGANPGRTQHHRVGAARVAAPSRPAPVVELGSLLKQRRRGKRGGRRVREAAERAAERAAQAAH